MFCTQTKTEHLSILCLLAGGGGFAFLRKSHAGCNMHPACCQEPAFESTAPILNLEGKTKESTDLYSLLWWEVVDSNHRSRRQQIYSLPPLATRETLPYSLQKSWSWWTDSNPRPADYKSAALPTELHQRAASFFIRRISQRLVYITTVFCVCQYFFQNKQKNCLPDCAGKQIPLCYAPRYASSITDKTSSRTRSGSSRTSCRLMPAVSIGL